MNLKLLPLTCLAMLASASVGLCDRPPSSPTELRNMADHMCAGIVVARNPVVTRSGGWQKTNFSVEMIVTSVLKGTELQPMERVFIASDDLEWVWARSAMQEAGWNGVGAPPAGAKILAYLTGSKAKGFRFVEPNGYVYIQTLRKFPNILNEHMTASQWATVEKDIENAAAVSQLPTNKYYVVAVVFGILLVFAGLFVSTISKRSNAPNL